MSSLRSRARLILAGALSLLLVGGAVAGPSFAHRDHAKGGFHPPSSGHRVLIIGHRGASGYRPEHTLASYELAARMGADYVEPDLVTTKDHVLVARHEPNITDTTNVADHPEFASRKTTKTIDGGLPQTGWFTDDFTLAELKTLRAKERLPLVRQGNTLYDGRYEVPTFQEVINLVKRLSKELHRDIGIYPETKHPTYFRDEGLPLEALLVKTLDRNGLNHRGARVFVQSFEVSNLKALNKVLRVPIVQLLDAKTLKPADVVKASGTTTYGDMSTPQGLKDIAEYADGVGPSKDYIVPRDANGNSLAPTSFLTDAHAAGLVVHPYTFRRENQFLPAELRVGSPADPNLPTLVGKAFDEDQQFFKLGVDGIFTDNADIGVAARAEIGF